MGSCLLLFVEVQHCPGGLPDSTASHAARGDLKGHPARLLHALQEGRHMEVFFICLHLGCVGSPGFLEFRCQILRFIWYLMVPAAAEGFGVDASFFLVNLFAGYRAEEIPVAMLKAQQLHDREIELAQPWQSQASAACCYLRKRTGER